MVKHDLCIRHVALILCGDDQKMTYLKASESSKMLSHSLCLQELNFHLVVKQIARYSHKLSSLCKQARTLTRSHYTR